MSAAATPRPADPRVAAGPLLRVAGLRVEFPSERGPVRAVDGVDFELAAGRTLAIVGESGSGKSATALAIMGLLSADARVRGRIELAGRDLLELDGEQLRRLRGSEVAMIFQDPLSALHPLRRVGWQVVEALRAHRPLDRRAARARAAELFELVGIPEPQRRLDAFPHELSGGLRQRAMIAMALAGEPRLLIADEPTTALDVTVQAQILALLRRLQEELGMALVLVTHDLGVVAELSDEVGVMYAGRIVERASTEQLFAAPSHPYTWGLLRSTPRLEGEPRALVPIPGRPPSPLALPSGCRFHPRCPYAQPEHARVEPALEPIPGEPGHLAACLLDPAARAELWRSGTHV
jgi:peptide/nickel transport system ATP-binding protein